jgi:hypothetical protein
MPTNKVALRTVEQFMADYQPVYRPIFGLLMKNAKSYPAEVGAIDFKRVETVGDIRAKHITPKDTEIKQISVAEGKKTFKKYFLANQFTLSALQDRQGIEDVNKQVLDEHNKQFDELLLLGEGTSASTMINNGIFWSNDANYVLKDSAEVAEGTAEDHLKDMHTKIMATVAEADDVAGEKLLMIYGATACAKFDSLYANTDAPFKRVLQEVLGSDWTVVKMPSAITPSNTNGWIAINLDQIQMHYTALPELKDQGVNDEKMYAWFNFLMGSAMIEVLAYKGIIRQPVTFAA